MFTRRTALGAIAASCALGTSAPAQTRAIYRTSVNTLYPNSPEMEALRVAIPAMRQSGFWDRQVDVHSHNWNQHQSWLFLPWHRAFLFQFEREVRRLTYDRFRMPYLDWDQDHIPAMLYDPPFAHDGRLRGPYDSMAAFQGTNGLRFSESAPAGFTGFFGEPFYGGDDESFGHDLVHMFVGGDMGDLKTAPKDPLFWFHHANVDRLWWYWSGLNGCNGAECYPSEWLSAQVNGIEDSAGRRLGPISVASLISTTALGYDYRETPILREMAAPPSNAPVSARKTVTQSISLNLLGGPSPSTTFSLPTTFLQTLMTAERAGIEAILNVRSRAMESHRIRIALIGRDTLQESQLFAMPMSMTGTGRAMNMQSAYVRNIGAMFDALPQGLSPKDANTRIAAEPFALRVEVLPFESTRSGDMPKLVECKCRITAKLLL